MRGEDGQPPRQFRASAVTERDINELIGICRGVLADGVLVQEEAQFLLDWLDRHRGAAETWPANVLYQRIRDTLADGVMDTEEEGDLLATLLQLTGEPVTDTDCGSMSSGLAPDCAPPPILFPGKTYCFTGKFFSGSRREVESQVLLLGGLVSANPTQNTDYVVVGTVGSRDWVHSTHGRKIERALELRAGGVPVAIIDEALWYEAVLAISES